MKGQPTLQSLLQSWYGCSPWHSLGSAWWAAGLWCQCWGPAGSWLTLCMICCWGWFSSLLLGASWVTRHRIFPTATCEATSIPVATVPTCLLLFLLASLPSYTCFQASTAWDDVSGGTVTSERKTRRQLVWNRQTLLQTWQVSYILSSDTVPCSRHIAFLMETTHQ